MKENGESRTDLSSVRLETPAEESSYNEFKSRYELFSQEGFRPLRSIKSIEIPRHQFPEDYEDVGIHARLFSGDPDGRFARAYFAAEILTRLKEQSSEGDEYVWTTGALIPFDTTDKKGKHVVRYSFDPQGITIFARRTVQS